MRKIIMTPGPTYIHEDVRRALSMEITNPDLDLEFYDLYRDTCDMIKEVLKTENETLILSGEGILGLEASCASLIESQDRVLCIDNGIFGEGFGEFIEMYGGECVYFKGDRRRGLNIEELREFLERDSDFKIATLVHCETPSGITNPIDKICKLLNSYGIITVVDAVASIGGEVIEVDEWKIDIALGASQKCFSAPPGLTVMSISDRAMEVMKNRREKIRGFYLNLLIWEGWYEKKWFPYTQPINDIYALKEALARIILEGEYVERHEKIARACRKAIQKCGLVLYPLDSFSNTVTTVMIPEGVTFEEINRLMVEKHGIMIGGAFGFLKDKVMRIGHMGENCRVGRMMETLIALQDVLEGLDVNILGSLSEEFLKGTAE